MPRELIQLASRYGKLAVLGTETIDGARMAHVRCDCGAETTVQAYALYKGRTRSCGSGCCKAYDRVKPRAGYQPQMPKAYNLEQVKRWHQLYTHKDISKRLSIPKIAEREGVNPNTMYSLFRSIAEAGGLDPYLQAIKWPETTKKNTAGTTASRSKSPTARSATQRAPVQRTPAPSARATARKSTTSSR